LEPARAENAAAKSGQTITGGGRKIDANEETVHGESLARDANPALPRPPAP
jgi:hypothetical protein